MSGFLVSLFCDVEDNPVAVSSVPIRLSDAWLREYVSLEGVTVRQRAPHPVSYFQK